uniref:HPr family phosphocarrier protein n=1 Tax=Endozoicomonas sp. Mp262 TaxID=2919499 RepID=UPI00351B9E93
MSEAPNCQLKVYLICYTATPYDKTACVKSRIKLLSLVITKGTDIELEVVGSDVIQVLDEFIVGSLVK